MLDVALAGSALLMGLAGVPHCLAMCGATCAAAGGRAPVSFQLGRLVGYAAAGAVAAASVQLLAQMGQASALLRPLWVMLHVAALMLGLALLWRGQLPAWLARLGQDVGHQLEVPLDGLRQGGVAFAGPAQMKVR
ncbi:MAG: sulfite exporter TauE/SafE family protein, partial [Burkholderiaceae bacterium]|nr:sulfite exporter TauE/SafE family protein [Burkholderiaceae bacterium]